MPGITDRLRPPPFHGPSALVGTLGLNVWITLVLVPVLFVGGARPLPLKVAIALPLVPLLVGVIWRRVNELLLAFPALLLLPLAMDERLIHATTTTGRTFFLTAGSLIGYLMGTAFVFSQQSQPARAATERSLWKRTRPALSELASGAPPSPLAPPELPARWRRRFRMYVVLAVLSAIFPLVLVYAANFDAAAQKELREVYPGRVASIRALINVIALGLWVGIYAVYFVGPLRSHRTGDKDLTRELGRIKASRPRPGWIFYLGVAAALAGIAAWFWLNSH